MLNLFVNTWGNYNTNGADDAGLDGSRQTVVEGLTVAEIIGAD